MEAVAIAATSAMIQAIFPAAAQVRWVRTDASASIIEQAIFFLPSSDVSRRLKRK
jgi:hypothetical protein